MKLLFLLITFLIAFYSNFVKANNINKKDYIPPIAYNYKDIILKELNHYFPDIPTYNYLPALAEHESCISLKHKRCWNPASRLKTKREEGAGLFQVTRTFRTDGSIRFDSLLNLKNKYKSELKEAKWETIYNRPDIQIRMAILHIRNDYEMLYSIPDKYIRLHFLDAAYNGGLNGVLKERRACGLYRNCDPNIWFNNVELHCLKSKKYIYGNRSACDINRHHVRDVILNKLPKYEKYYFTKNEQKIHNP